MAGELVSRRRSRATDWGTVALRLEDIAAAHSGRDTFEEVHALLIGLLASEHRLVERSEFLPKAGAAVQLGEWLTAARRAWPGLHSTYESGLSDAALADCREVLDGLSVSRDEGAGLDAIFEHLTTRSAKGSKGQFFTPRHVVDHILDILGPRSGERILDPACGSGAFLARARSRHAGCVVYGADLSPRAAQVCRTALVPSGVASERVLCADSLVRGQSPLPSSVDVIATNPPFAGDVSGQHADDYELCQSGRRVERDVLFLERCVELLAPHGRLGLVLPNNKVGSARFAHVRRWLLCRMRVFGVVSLPPHTFAPHTTQRAVALIAQKRGTPLSAPNPSDDICFVVSELDAKDARGRLNRHPDSGEVRHDLDEATQAIRAHIERTGDGAGWR